ncbi:NAD(P)H-dependent oxidoreductase [Streptomyces sp. N2-109]|uniref:NAD(P)H-dependent oxidoreductase n=1 Tax=Streptomyces gossypii TaxID=2883101 RepID=A0ABT2JRI7_9ACTN|nr:NAD(P)H-dependent oxidoreductase [Streptomyces gossypii]MCT2590505.1 NAD(P)H-dependent oxidoreductase [Streptomyces gossypii]
MKPTPWAAGTPSTTASRRLRVAVIIGSTREGRVGDAVCRWVTDRAGRRGDLEPKVVDLAEFVFPARYPELPTPQMAAFTAEIDRAEAFVIVTPEYNRSFPASLKQAIDFAYDEWHAKPVGFVSYGCRSRGLYAVEALRSVFVELHTVTMRNSASFDLLTAEGEDGEGEDWGGCTDGEQDATAMLDQLSWWGHALRDARAAHPYVS